MNLNTVDYILNINGMTNTPSILLADSLYDSLSLT